MERPSRLDPAHRFDERFRRCPQGPDYHGHWTVAGWLMLGSIVAFVSPFVTSPSEDAGAALIFIGAWGVFVAWVLAARHHWSIHPGSGSWRD